MNPHTITSNSTPIERWNITKRFLEENKETKKKTISILHLLWQNFCVFQRKQVWDNMDEVERESWFSARHETHIKKKLLIDTAETPQEEKKRRKILAYIDGEFLGGTYKQVVEKINNEFSVAVCCKGTPIERWNASKCNLRLKLTNREKTIQFLHLLWQIFCVSERRQVWNNMKGVEREFWFSARLEPHVKQKLLIDTAENSNEAKKCKIVFARRGKEFLDGTYIQIVEKIKEEFPVVIHELNLSQLLSLYNENEESRANLYKFLRNNN